MRTKQLESAFRSLKSTTVSLWVEAQRRGLSHAELLTLRQKRIFDHPQYAKLPGYAKHELFGAWNYAFDYAYRVHLTFCYNHPITGIVTPAKELCDAGLASQIDTATGDNYWQNADGTYSNRF